MKTLACFAMVLAAAALAGWCGFVLYVCFEIARGVLCAPGPFDVF